MPLTMDTGGPIEMCQTLVWHILGLAGIEPIADDIMVVGCGDRDVEVELDNDNLDPDTAVLEMPTPMDVKAV